MKRKSLAILLSAVMVVAGCLAGCGNSGNDSTPAQTQEQEQESEPAAGEEEKEAPAESGGGSNLEESLALFDEAVANLMTTDGHPMLAPGVTFDVPEAEGTAEELEALDDSQSAKWHFYEYLDWDESQDAQFPASPADGAKGKHVIMIVHGAHAWTTCFSEAFEQACEAVGMTCDIYDPNWDQSTQDGYIDQAINEQPDAIGVIPVSADHAAQQFKKITDAGIPAFCVNTTVNADAMNYVMAFTGPNDWYQMRTLADSLGEAMNGEGGVAYITHNVGGSPYYARCYGPLTELAEKYPNIKTLDIQSPGFEAAAVKQVVADWITKYGDELKAIVLADDSDQAIGTVEAIKAANRSDILVVAAGISKQGAELVESGDLYMMSYQSCQGDAGLAVRTMAEYFNGVDISRVSYIGTDVINKDNVADFTPCQW
ncbi:MAG: substrate-binding domain-containing protein [Lachnospiraceae bacterium]|nr:substrate-binding domain-containing protein [Lachnospiraceae bacterium]